MKCMEKKWPLSVISAACAAIALMAGAPPVLAENEYASVFADSTGIDVQTYSDHGLAITVSGSDGVIIQQTIAAGQDSELFGGGYLPDGYYNYEISPIPPDHASDTVSEANVSPEWIDENGRSVWARPGPVSNPTVQTGGFRILGGALVDPNIPE